MICIEVASFPVLREKLGNVMSFWKRRGNFVSVTLPFAAKSSGGREEHVTLRLLRVIFKENALDKLICRLGGVWESG